MRMISSLTIEGYRCFDHFEMSGLGRVNLLVGKNNSGKTSGLEAIYLLMSQGDPSSLSYVRQNRSEVFEVSTSPLVERTELDASHLFAGHSVRVGSRFRLSASNDSTARHV